MFEEKKISGPHRVVVPGSGRRLQSPGPVFFIPGVGRVSLREQTVNSFSFASRTSLAQSLSSARATQKQLRGTGQGAGVAMRP